MEYDFDNDSLCAADVEDITELDPKPRKRGPRIRYSAEQLELLEAVFSVTSYPSKIQVHNLTKQTKLPATVVRRWFNQKRFKSSVLGPRERIHLIPKTIETNDTNIPHRKKYKTVLIRINSPSQSSHNVEHNASNLEGSNSSNFGFLDSQNSASAKSMKEYEHNNQVIDEATFEHAAENSPYSFDGEFDSSFSMLSSASQDSDVGYFCKESTPHASLNERFINDEMRLCQNEVMNEIEFGGCLRSEMQPPGVVNQPPETAQSEQCSVEHTTEPMDVVQYQYVNMNDLHELGIDVNNFDDLPVLHTGTEHHTISPSTTENGWTEEHRFSTSVNLDTNKDGKSTSNSSPLNTESSKVIIKTPADVIGRHVMESEEVVKPKTTESYKNRLCDISSDIVTSSTNLPGEPPPEPRKNVIILKRPSNSQNNFVADPLVKKRMQRLFSRNGASKSYLPTASTTSRILFKSSKSSDADMQNVPGFRPKIKVYTTKAPVTNKKRLEYNATDNPKHGNFESNSRKQKSRPTSDTAFVVDDVTSSSTDLVDLTKPVEPSNTLSNTVATVSPDSTEPKPKDSQSHCCCCHGSKPLQTQQVGPIAQPLLTTMPLICFLPIQLPVASLSSLLQQSITAQDSTLPTGNSTTR